ncbi:eukaryotic translation initiation factor 4E-like isoform X2 [Watersipora subatra]
MELAIGEIEQERAVQKEDTHALQKVVPEPVIKHPLQNKWALWYFKNDRTKTWNDNLKLVATFQFVEDFWALYNFIQPASKLPGGCDYSVFKDGIQPAWEDVRNQKGGRWLINVNKKQQDLDFYWLELLLCLIGEAFGEQSDDICGAVVNIRGKGDKIALWTSDGDNEEGIKYIGQLVKERLGMGAMSEINYFVHEDSISRTGSQTQCKFKQ